MTEVELKVRITESPEVLGRRIEETYKLVGSSVHKQDIYYKKDSFYFRLRREEGKVFLTYKEKTLEGQTEVNQEWETAVGSLEVLEGFMRRLEILPLYCKEKKGYSFQQENLTLELLEVTGLGFFLELEINLSTEASESEIQEAQEKLRATLYELKISPELIESRSYQKLLGY